MAFLRALLDVVNDVPNVAMLVVMIASDATDGPVGGGHGASRRPQPPAGTQRLPGNGHRSRRLRRHPSSSTVRRSNPAERAHEATAGAFESVLKTRRGQRASGSRLSAWRDNCERGGRALLSVPPDADAMARERVESKVTGFQRVRSTIRIFAATVYSPSAARRGRRLGSAPDRSGRPSAFRLSCPGGNPWVRSRRGRPNDRELPQPWQKSKS